MNAAPTWLTALRAIVQRDLRLAFRNRGELATPLLFFVLVVALFPLALSPTPALLATLAPAVVWVAALLATLLSLDRLFRADFEDGSLELMALSPTPLMLQVLAKVLAHWLLTGLPLLLVSPVLGYMLALPRPALPVLVLGLALGTPVLSLVGAIGVALTLGLRQAGALLALIVLPLYVPVLIFGASACASAAAELPSRGPLLVLGAFLALALSLAPLAAAAALRISLD